MLCQYLTSLTRAVKIENVNDLNNSEVLRLQVGKTAKCSCHVVVVILQSSTSSSLSLFLSSSSRDLFALLLLLVVVFSQAVSRCRWGKRNFFFRIPTQSTRIIHYSTIRNGKEPATRARCSASCRHRVPQVVSESIFSDIHCKFPFP